MKHAIREFKIWTVCSLAGVAVLATEVAVKARRPVPLYETTELTLPQTADSLSVPELGTRAEVRSFPEELVTQLLVDSIVQIESSGNPRTVGSKGERGLMQIKELTWRETTRRIFGRSASFKRAFDPALNRKVGTAYLGELHAFLHANRENWQADERSLLLACYNAGPTRVAKARFRLDRLPASTRDYVQRATALHDVFLEEHALKVEPSQVGGALQIVQAARDWNS